MCAAAAVDSGLRIVLKDQLMCDVCNMTGSIEEALAELDMEHYDDEDDGEEGGGGRPFGIGPPGMSFYR